MALTDKGVEQAEYTFCYERRERRGEAPELVPLPWAKIVFRDASEAGKVYVHPLPPVGLSITAPAGAGDPTWRPYRAFVEIMPNLPFPLESARQNGLAPGPIAVHFFGV